ncbi:hypothetical protein [Mesorhizobium erdmanii]|nr:hypothetical protein [Mesorhizobium erdmanii]
MVFGTHELTQTRLLREDAIEAVSTTPVFATGLCGDDGAAFGAQHD